MTGKQGNIMSSINTWTSSPNSHHMPWEHIPHKSPDETSAGNSKPSKDKPESMEDTKFHGAKVQLNALVEYFQESKPDLRLGFLHTCGCQVCDTIGLIKHGTGKLKQNMR